ncbi:hypothetical protein PVAP13_6NG232103 [Panicum virgatum]|uniref:Uncharacterized protein n=1 Tax=Panicum virgatum TaxID=38727 RepID=A0A8T0QZC0_PANVG|nr:hypothetical protein PVAP13_6NG232103 [Panicum virgatum]
MVQKAAPGPKVQSSSATHGEPTAQPQPSATCVGGTPELRSHLNEVRASEDAHTALERARERRHQATDEHASSGVPRARAPPPTATSTRTGPAAGLSRRT